MSAGNNAEIRQRFELLRDRWLPRIVELTDDVIAISTSESSSFLREMADYHLGTGGKRLRAILPLLIAEGLGADPVTILPFAAACEMLHNASLVHDDIQDEDSARRGQPAIWKKFGIPQAINLGDAMIGWTLLLMCRLEVEASLKELATRRVLMEMLRVIEGQVEELAMRRRKDVSLAEYMRMVEKKTSALFALPMCGAALLSDAGEPLERGLLESAGHIGVLYQIQDDILDIYGDKGRGDRANDIREGKRSILAVHCMEVANPSEAEWIRTVLAKPRSATTPGETAHAISLFERYGSLSFAFNELASRKHAALSVPALASYPTLLRILEDACAMFLAPVASLKPIEAAL